VLWVATGVSPKDVWKETDRRERLFGIAEKLRKGEDSKARRKIAAASTRRIRKSRRRA
jgi:phosphoribosyl-ATP pyrophosphohydrolase